jgi:cation diffusion facilitator CzcD-associated flavoprotein CzcO
MTQSPKACIIGAGCSGFTTAKRLKDLVKKLAADPKRAHLV